MDEKSSNLEFDQSELSDPCKWISYKQWITDSIQQVIIIIALFLFIKATVKESIKPNLGAHETTLNLQGYKT